MTVSKVYTFRVTIGAGQQPNPAAETVAQAWAQQQYVWDVSITVNVEADHLEDAREKAIAVGETVAEEVVPGWQDEAESNQERERPHLWRTTAPSVDDVSVNARFEDLVVGTAGAGDSRWWDDDEAMAHYHTLIEEGVDAGAAQEMMERLYD